MNLSKILKNTFFMVIFCLVVTACATKKTVETTDTTTETAKAEEKKVEKVEEKIEPEEPIAQLGSLMQGLSLIHI